MQNDSAQNQEKVRVAFWLLICVILFLALKLCLFLADKQFTPEFKETSGTLAAEQVLYFSVVRGIYLGFFVSVFNSLTGLIALSWASKKNNSFFFGTFFGWMALKLATLALVAFYVYSRSQYHIVSTLLSLVGFTFVLTLTTIKTVPHSGKGTQV